jgi:hypothetical protein
VITPRVPAAFARKNRLSKQVAAAYRLAVQRYHKKSWVTGVMIAAKERGGRIDETAPGPVIAILVKRKLKRGVPKHKRIPRTILGVPTDVVQMNFTRRQMASSPIPMPVTLPLRPGRSIGRETTGSAGSVGVIATDTEGQRYLLTALHVLREGAGSNQGNIVHPGPLDAIGVPQVVAEISRTHAGADAGIAKLTPQTLAADNQVAFGSGETIGSPDDPQLLQRVRKSGRSTGSTEAIVQGWGPATVGVYPALLLRLPDDAAGPGWDAGDSGAVWYDVTTFRGIALHVGEAQGSGVTYAIASGLGYVANKLRISW